ncbi:hypothetical protein BRADI_4g45416v3, partial [Brachypodium distachyon]
HATEPRHRSSFSRQRAPLETKPPSSSRPCPSVARRPPTSGTGSAGAAAGCGVRSGWEPTGCGERGGGMTRRRIPSLYPLAPSLFFLLCRPHPQEASRRLQPQSSALFLKSEGKIDSQGGKQ